MDPFDFPCITNPIIQKCIGLLDLPLQHHTKTSPDIASLLIMMELLVGSRIQDGVCSACRQHAKRCDIFIIDGKSNNPEARIFWEVLLLLLHTIRWWLKSNHVGRDYDCVAPCHGEYCNVGVSFAILVITVGYCRHSSTYADWICSTNDASVIYKCMRIRSNTQEVATYFQFSNVNIYQSWSQHSVKSENKVNWLSEE